MALSDVEAIVFARSDDVVAEAVKDLERALLNDYRAFTSRIYGGIMLIVIGLGLFIFTYYMPTVSIIMYAGLGIVVLGFILLLLAFFVKSRVETASLKLYPILFAGFEHGEFFAIDPLGNGDDVTLIKYSIEDANKLLEKYRSVQDVLEKSFKGFYETRYELLSDGDRSIIVSTPYRLLYQEYRSLVDLTNNIRVEEKTYNMIFPEENDVPLDLMIPIEKSGFSEELSLKKISLDEVDKLFDELVSTSRNWEDIVDKLKDLREKIEPIHGQIVSRFKWLYDSMRSVLPSIVKPVNGLYVYICPQCLLSKNYFTTPQYPELKLMHLKREDVETILYQCPECGYSIEADELLIPRDPLSRPIVDNVFNEIWLGIYSYNRGYIDKVINDSRRAKEDLLNKLYSDLKSNAEVLSKELEEFVKRIDAKIMDIGIYTNILKKLGITGAEEVYKAVYENTEYMKKTLLNTPNEVKEILLELLKIRIDPIILNNTYLETRKKAAEKIGRTDITQLIDSEYETIEYEKLLKLYTPLLVETPKKIEEKMEVEEK